MRIQWLPNLVRSERRLCLTRLRWETGTGPTYRMSDGQVARAVWPNGYSQKLSISIQWNLEDFWIGAFWKRECSELTVWVCLLPCLPIRFHYTRSHGGIIP